MAVPTKMGDLSTTAASNSPAGSESPTAGDDFIRAYGSIIRFTQAIGADIASASTTDLSTATGHYVNITGTTTITSLGTLAAGIKRTVVFAAASTLTHNATSLILPSSANITTAAGDVAEFTSLGSGNWKCTNYERQSGAPLVQLTTAPFVDTTAIVKGSSDATKLLAFEVDTNIPTATTRTIVAQSISGTLELVESQIKPISATVAANALTLTLNPCALAFRSSTIGSGTVNVRSVNTAITLVVPSTATLGTVNAIQHRLALLAIDNAGTVELAVVNVAGGSDLTETGVISTTAIAAASNSATTFYSTTARASVPYRVVGYVESTQATAGTWATAPSTIQGAGGNSLQHTNAILNGVSIATTSGTSIDFTGIPSWVRRVTIMLNGVSTTGTSNCQIQLGTSGGVVTSGYVGASDNQASGGGTTTSFTTGLGLERTSTAAYIRQGIATFVLQTGNTWVGTYLGSSTGSVTVAFGSTAVSLGATLDRIRLTTVGGADTFDAGSMNIIYE